jgi:PHD/YefM family antitoxin component YafN of YafNO toxin-antitoxin module
MLEVTASEFVKHFGEYKEKVQRQPIAITSHGRTRGYFVSPHEYDEYLKLKSQARQFYGLDDLTDTTIDALSKAEMNTEHSHLNALMN